MGNTGTKLPPLKTVASCSTEKFMGTWFVIGVKPTVFETTCSNAVEKYSFVGDSESYDINIDFQYNNYDPITSPLKALPQKGWVQGEDKKNSSVWKVSPFGPIRMPYLIIELDEDNYDYCVVGYPSRNYCWIMGRNPIMSNDTYNMLTDRLVKNHQYDLNGLRKVPQKWTKEERSKRGLTETEIPDSMLSDLN
jgi:apolipoprotein D and lipocalin family protein